MRIDKVLANLAIGSRKEVHELIKKGFVTINGELCKSKEQHIHPQKDVICVKGALVHTQLIYYVMLHKPSGYVTAIEDSMHKTVMDLLPFEYRKLKIAPVGRLDKDTEGLLLLTNDGQWAHRIIHGKKDVEKVYFFVYEGRLVDSAVQDIAQGLPIDGDELCKAARLELLSPKDASNYTSYALAPREACGLLYIREGKYHQVKRMIRACGGVVTYLKRIRIGALTLEGLSTPGTYRHLDKDEIIQFK